MQAAETPVAHDQRVIARTQGLCELLRQCIDLCDCVPPRAQRGDERRGVPAEVGRREQPDLISERERRAEGVAVLEARFR